MLRRSIFLILVLTLFCTSITAFAAENDTVAVATVQKASDSIDVHPYLVYTYNRTIPYDYVSYESIPSTHYYSEYIVLQTGYPGFWATGTLDLQSVVKTSNGWRATYTGTISGNF